MIKIVPAILRKSFEGIQEDWSLVVESADFIQLDVTDGIFAGDGTWQDVARFTELGDPKKIELHMMVQRPADFLDAVIALDPGRCIWHVESFGSEDDIREMFEHLRMNSSISLALARNPITPVARLEKMLNIVDYVLFMGVDPGYTGAPLVESVFSDINSFLSRNPDVKVAVDGSVNKASLERFVKAGARQLCAHSSIFGEGSPSENMEQLRLLAESFVPAK